MLFRSTKKLLDEQKALMEDTAETPQGFALDPREPVNKGQEDEVEQTDNIRLNENVLERTVRIGSHLDPQLKTDLSAFLIEFADVFA